MNPFLHHIYYSGGNSSSYSEELQAVVNKASAEGYTKPPTAVLRVYDDSLIKLLKASEVIPWDGWDTLNFYGFGSIEFGSLNLINSSTHQHTFPVFPDFSQPQNDTDPFGVRSGSLGYVKSNYAANQYSGIESDLTMIADVAEEGAETTVMRIFGARTLSASASPSLFLTGLVTISAGQAGIFTGANSFPNTDHKGLYVVTRSGTQPVIYKNGTKDTNSSTTLTAPDLANDVYFLGYNNSSSGGDTPSQRYTKYCRLLARYRGDWTDAMELEFRTIYNTFLSNVVTAYLEAVSSPNTYTLVIDLGQSNANGLAEVNRLALTDYSDTNPVNVYSFYKGDYSDTGNGRWERMSLGNNNNITSTTPQNLCGAECSLGPLLRDRSNKPVFYLKCTKNGTSLHTDWDPSTPGSLFQVATEYYFDVALTKLQAMLPPDSIIKPVIVWHQGEQDATDERSQSEYLGDLEEFFTAFRAHDSLLTSAPLVMVKILNSGPETVPINDALQEYADNTENVYIIDIEDQPTKAELTTEQKGGFEPTSASGDDNHWSYLAQIAKGERVFNKLVEIDYI